MNYRDYGRLDVTHSGGASGVTYQVRYVGTRQDTRAGYQPVGACMYCNASDDSWSLQFREPAEDAGYGHVPRESCCDRCHDLIEAGDCAGISALVAEYTGPENGDWTTKLGRELFVASRRA